MKLTIATKQRWHRPVLQSSLDNYRKSKRARLRSTINRIDTLENIKTVIQPLDKDFVNWFEPLYEKTISIKNNALVKNVTDLTLGNPELEHPMFSLSLVENGKFTGGTIYDLRDDMLVVHFRIYNNKWATETLQASPALYTDYILSEEALAQNKTIFSHGQDRNPYGVNASIGLANFKLSVGCVPKLTKEPEFIQIDTDDISVDALILIPPESGDVITEAKLFCTPESEAKYAQLLSFSDVINFDVIHR